MIKNRWKILIGILAISGLLYAATQTKFYGDILMQSHKILDLATDSSANSATTKGYVDTQILGLNSVYLPRTGGTMSGTIYMGSTHQIKNLANPTASQDGATKSYVDSADLTKLSLSGGTMSGDITMSDGSTIKGVPVAPSTDDTVASQGLLKYYYSEATNYAGEVSYGKLSLSGGSMEGDISMGGHRITAMNDPQDDFDGANKRYVDRAINEGNAYQYFALKKGNGFTPFYALDSNTGRVFEVVICRAFRGAITSYYENIATTNSAIYSNVVRRWNVGEKIRVPFKLAANTLSATNGTLVVKGGSGIVGNFGITTPPNSGVVYPFKMIADNEDYYPDTSINLYSEGLWSGTSFTFKLKNLTPNTIHIVVNFSEAKYYTSNTSYSSAYIEVNGTPQTLPYEVHLAFAADEEKTFTLDVLTYDVLYGLRWSFDIDMGYGNAYHFGQFFVPNGN